MAKNKKSKRTKRKHKTTVPKIDRGVKIPARGTRAPSALVTAAGKMKIGDSFLGGASTTTTTLNKRLKPKRFSARVRGGKRRIWRVK